MNNFSTKPKFSPNVIRTAVEAQSHLCIYCLLPFGTLISWSGGRSEVTAPVGDHFVPLSFEGITRRDNCVASCQLCNGIKYCRMFDSISDARDFVAASRRRKKVVADFTPTLASTDDPDYWLAEYAQWRRQNG